MSLNVSIDEPKPQTKRLLLDGSLDANTAPQFDQELQTALTSDVETVILDLSDLKYISSAGLRVIFKVRQTMKVRNGEIYVINPQPQIKKVFDIVKALPVGSVFSCVEELDRYLDAMQRKTLQGE
ncbi:MAG: STAS domain-containing protein [Xenococcaceae cyanobacterium]